MSNETKELKEQLLISSKKKIHRLSDEELAKADEFCEPYKDFLNKARTEREAVTEALAMAKENGFKEYNPDITYSAGDKVYIVNRNKAIGLAVIGRTGTSEGVLLSIAHIDSPRIDLKPNPLYEKDSLALFKTHYYGGIKKYQWTTIPLALHGRVCKTDGTYVDISIGDDESDPCFCISDILPHLGQEQAQKKLGQAFTGEDLNCLIGSRPYSDEEGEQVRLNTMKLIYDKYGFTENDFLSAELSLVPACKSRDVGFDRSMIGSYGHDDRVCAYTALMAIIDAGVPEKTCITYLTDKEETGSDGNTGMQSDFLRYFIYDMAKSEGQEGYRVLSKSKCLSADVNAAVDPTYASCFESKNCSYLNEGVVISKYTGARGKSGTSDASAEYMGEIRTMLESNDIIWQVGELGRVDLGGGGTIAKYVANMNVDVVDLGVPVLSMHAPFEIVAKVDVYMAYLAFLHFFVG
ncbi:MAG: aminopeptidase [Ruminococcus sp.]|nr:aminopeptidase [Ruminococcus sp.]